MTEYAIQAENVVKKFGDFTAINNITLNVPKGSIYGFLGPNGCGKSTTIRVLTGLLSPSEGNVDVLGLEIPRQSELLRLKIGYMTQNSPSTMIFPFKKTSSLLGRSWHGY